MRSKLVATVHDSVVLDCPPEEVVEMAEASKFIMENLPIPFLKFEWRGDTRVYPIEADAEVGINYKDVVPFDREEYVTFKSIGGYARYYKDLATLVDYRNSKELSVEQFEAATKEVKGNKHIYQNI